MLCFQCGTETARDAKLCNACGTAISSMQSHVLRTQSCPSTALLFLVLRLFKSQPITRGSSYGCYMEATKKVSGAILVWIPSSSHSEPRPLSKLSLTPFTKSRWRAFKISSAVLCHSTGELFTKSSSIQSTANNAFGQIILRGFQ